MIIDISKREIFATIFEVGKLLWTALIIAMVYFVNSTCNYFPIELIFSKGYNNKDH
jgi:hypothetical protein